MFRKITLFIAGILATAGASAQCPTLSCPGNITVVKDPNTCSKTVNYTAPVGVDPCFSTPVTVNFSYTGSVQTWTVPAGVTSITVDAKGGGGGMCTSYGTVYSSNIPGKGGRAQATVPVVPGSVINIYVGGKGADAVAYSAATGGWNGGGTTSSNGYQGGAGGGATDIRIGGTALTDRKLVAAGGGGAGMNCSSGMNGGDGGGTTGTAGMYCSSFTTCYGGQGGTQSGGGAAATCYSGPTSGTLGNGGDGTYYGGGGGGGGYYGGGGGAYGGGGGGSSYAATGLTSVTLTTGGGNTQNGSLSISYVPQPTTVQIAGLPSGASYPVGVTTNTFVTTGGGNVTDTCSFTVTVTDPFTPAFTAQPTATTNVCNGGTVTLATSVTNSTGLQWYRNGVAVSNGSNVTGATTSTLTITNIAPNQYGNFVLRATGVCNLTNSDTAAVIAASPAAITTQPQGGQNICNGNAFTLSAAASNVSAYQWYRNGNPLSNGGDVSGATSPTLNIINADANDIGSYTVQATGYSGCASATSNGASVNVNLAPAVTSVPPSSMALCSGASINLDVIANNSNGYQWYRNNVALSNGGGISGANSPNLVVSNVTSSNAGSYHVVVLANSGCNNAPVAPTAITINNAPVIVNQPQASQDVCAGTTMIANVVAQNATAYQWYKDGIPLNNGGNISGATSATLQVTNTNSSYTGSYTVELSPLTSCPPLTSSASVVTINPNASVLTQPIPSVTICEGNAFELSVTAGGAASYQWYRNGNALTNGLGVSGAQSPNLLVQNANAFSNGNYHVAMTAYYTGCQGTTSSSSAVSVTPMASIPAPNNTTETFYQADGRTHIYMGSSCDPIVKVEDPVGGNVLGNVDARVTIDGSIQSYGSQPYVARHVDVEPASDGLATVTLYATQADFDLYNAFIPGTAPQLPTGGVNNGNVKVMQFHGTGTIPGNYTGSMDILTPVSVVWNGNWYEIKLMVGGFSGFYIYSDFALAIKLNDISAENQGTTNVVNWSTSTEDKGDVFVVERSIDGREFSAIGTVNAKGEASDYRFVDEKAVTGTNYYRLQLQELNGHTSYSSVVSAKVAKGGVIGMQAFPNPTSDNVTVKLSEEAGANATIQVLDYTGKVLSTQAVSGNSTLVEMNAFPAGMYILKYVDGENRTSIKINKQ